MLESLLGLSIATLVCMLFPQTRSIGALGMLVLAVLCPKIFLGVAALGGIGYYVFKR
jgi:hypothetical protein